MIKTNESRMIALFNSSDIRVYTAFDKCIIVACELPNGFVIVEDFSFSKDEEFDKDKGIDICIDKILSKISELDRFGMFDDCYEHMEYVLNDECEEEVEECGDCRYCTYLEQCLIDETAYRKSNINNAYDKYDYTYITGE